ncbi:MAG: SUMF1/EgtB/PvdO family nonheme iron enzyme [Myxococcota bacterium]|nr:SUMF1/EgtB/PvdO family nonheme iron enzyme [Myxococcota bacterium]
MVFWTVWSMIGIGCQEGKNEPSFASSSISGSEDADSDGVPSGDDCNDDDPSDAAQKGDCDQDGIPAEEDCNDFDALVGSRTHDSDCDGIIAEEDCDDNDSSLGNQNSDADCDGTITEEDCDDGDADSTTTESDADCDGTITEEDCDDHNPLASEQSQDADCDGAITEEDCDDNDPSVGNQNNDADCDGTITEEDCDDNNPLFALCQHELDLGNGFSLSSVQLPSGTFVMGSPEEEIGRAENETPHAVTLTNPVYVSKTEITQGMFFQMMGYQSHAGYPAFGGLGDSYPAYYVSWHMAAAFANQVTARHNLQHEDNLSLCYSCAGSDALVTCSEIFEPYECDGYRLLTEAEWEYAARGRSTSAFWTPNGGGELLEDDVDSCEAVTLSDGTLLSSLAEYCASNSSCESAEVGQSLPNDFGLFDMSGNVMEWVHDYYATFDTSSVIDPVSSPNSSYVVRGGHACDTPRNLRSARRTEINISSSGANAREVDVGFRIGRTAP